MIDTDIFGIENQLYCGRQRESGIHIHMRPVDRILHGGSKLFTFALRAPDAPGNHQVHFRMACEGNLFGPELVHHIEIGSR